MLMECANCREPLFEDIKTCPQCGAANRAYEAPRWRRVVLVAGIVLAALILSEILSEIVPWVFMVLGFVVFSLATGVFVLRDRGPKTILLWVLGNIGILVLTLVVTVIALVVLHVHIWFFFIYGGATVALLRWLGGRPKPA